MNKKILFSLLGAGLTTVGITAASLGFQKVAPQDSPQNAPETSESVQFYGALEQSFAWTQTPEVGFYSFSDNGDDLKAVSETQSGRRVTGGGAYADGYFYYINGQQTLQGVSNTFNKLDTDTWKVVDSSGHNSPTKTDAISLAYDYITARMYACSVDEEAHTYMLRSVNLESGEFTDVAKLDHNFTAMAFDANGQLWGIAKDTSTFPYEMHLYKINHQTGASQHIGGLGYNQKPSYAAAIFDFRTGKLYWQGETYTTNEHYEESYVSYLLEVNLQTGKATVVREFPACEIFGAIFIKGSHPKAPAAAEELKMNYSQTSPNNGVFSFKVPAKRYDGSALSGSVKAEVFVDGELKYTLNALAAGGEAKTPELTLSNGSHDFRVYLYDSAGNKSVAADTKIWGGKDVPAAPQNIKVTATDRGDRATVTWDPVTTSKSGGVFDSRNVSYKVILRPDMQVVAENLKTTSFTCEPERNMLLSQFEIVPVTPDGEGVHAVSTPFLLGSAYSMPYLETFDTQTAFNTFTLISVNGVANEGGDRWLWHPDFRSACYWLNYDYYNKPDAWLITPTLALEKDKVYRLQFQTRGFASGESYLTLTAAVGALPTVESLDREILRHSGKATTKTNYTTCSSLFLAEEGDCRIGLHLVSDGNDHTEIDNLRVAYYGPSTIPAAPEVVSSEKSGSAAVLTVKAPKVDTKGNAISSLVRLSLYRKGSSTPLATVSNPPVGAEIRLRDANPVDGPNDYIITASNADGEGLESTAFINMNSAAPLKVSSVVLRVSGSGDDVDVSWTYPEGYPSATGSVLDPSEITYDLYRGKDLIARDLKTTSYHDADVKGLYPDDLQKRVSYSVVASTSGGKSEMVTSECVIGRAYDIPVSEHDFYEMSTRPWTSSPAAAWIPTSRGYEPMTDPFTGSSLMTCTSAGRSEQYWTSPRFNLTSLAEPELTFYLHGDPGNQSYLEIGVIPDVDGVEQNLITLPGVHSCDVDESGWRKVTVSLAECAKYNRASIVFIGHANGRPIYVDDIDIDGRKLNNDARVRSLSGPSNCVLGRENVYTANVHNNGLNPVTDAVVKLMFNGSEVASKKISLAVDATENVELTYAPGLDGEECEGKISMSVTAANDENHDNDYDEMRVQVIVPNVPYVHDLQGSYDAAKEEVSLFWNEPVKYPRAFPVKDDFESYDNFIIDNIGDWKLVDEDGEATIAGIRGSYGTLTWTNCGLPQAYIVFNPRVVGTNDLAPAFSGEKCLVAMSAASKNDDWLISPQLLGAEQTISFYARSMHPSYPEQFEILVSKTGDNPADFERLKLSQAASDWKKYEFDLPEGSRYFAIRCVSEGKFAFMVDDIEYIPAQPSVDLLGFNLYRDGESLASSIGETEYADRNVKMGEEHTYHVRALYADGESISSNACFISTTGVNGVGVSNVKVYSTDNTINIEGAAALLVSVSALDGKLLYNFTGTGRDAVSVVPGIYLVTVADRAVKILVK